MDPCLLQVAHVYLDSTISAESAISPETMQSDQDCSIPASRIEEIVHAMLCDRDPDVIDNTLQSIHAMFTSPLIQSPESYDSCTTSQETIKHILLDGIVLGIRRAECDIPGKPESTFLYVIVLHDITLFIFSRPFNMSLMSWIKIGVQNTSYHGLGGWRRTPCLPFDEYVSFNVISFLSVGYGSYYCSCGKSVAKTQR